MSFATDNTEFARQLKHDKPSTIGDLIVQLETMATATIGIGEPNAAAAATAAKLLSEACGDEYKGEPVLIQRTC